MQVPLATGLDSQDQPGEAGDPQDGHPGRGGPVGHVQDQDRHLDHRDQRDAGHLEGDTGGVHEDGDVPQGLEDRHQPGEVDQQRSEPVLPRSGVEGERQPPEHKGLKDEEDEVGTHASPGLRLGVPRSFGTSTPVGKGGAGLWRGY